MNDLENIVSSSDIAKFFIINFASNFKLDDKGHSSPNSVTEHIFCNQSYLGLQTYQTLDSKKATDPYEIPVVVLKNRTPNVQSW